ncbi:hypothetical protein GGI07_000319 [Coemansia sp. Benny D115]|nr:hypothetical protein GGI07_000319 [Coemansia sp. Benny D115]
MVGAQVTTGYNTSEILVLVDGNRWYYGPSLEDELVGRSRSAENSEHLSQHAYHQEHTAFEVSDTAAAAAAGVQGRGVRSNRRSLRRSSSRRHGHRHGHGRSGSGRWDRLLLMMGASEMASAGRMPV